MTYLSIDREHFMTMYTSYTDIQKRSVPRVGKPNPF